MINPTTTEESLYSVTNFFCKQFQHLQFQIPVLIPRTDPNDMTNEKKVLCSRQPERLQDCMDYATMPILKTSRFMVVFAESCAIRWLSKATFHITVGFEQNCGKDIPRHKHQS